jgi:hypothetical protein
MSTNKKPTTHQGDLAKLPPALASLVARPQWCIWRWTMKPDGSWQKPPFVATDPGRNASSTDPSTWADYATARAAVQAGHGNGITYVLTKNDPYAAVDLDHCRDASTGSIDRFAQNFLTRSRGGYAEITPSGDGLRIWGLADGTAVHRAFALKIDEKDVKVELFRRANKPLTITGLELVRVPELTGIDQLIDWAVISCERRKAAEKPVVPVKGNGFNGGGCGYSIDEIEQIVRTGAPAGANRSDTFHTIVGHYLGFGWDAERIFAHLQQFPDGIGARYLRENRLHTEIARSAGKYTAGTLPLSNTNGWVNSWETKAPQPDPELDDNSPEQQKSPEPEIDEEPDLDPDEDDIDEGLEEDEPPERDPNLPPLFAHGDPDARPLKSWLIKRLIPVRGHGLLSGQWGTGKTFVAFDLAAALGTGQPFLGHAVKRQCGVLLIAAEVADEVRLRFDAVIRAKCGGTGRAPFRWYETAPMLLHKGSAETLIAMAKQADASLQDEFGLPLGLIIIDTIASCAGYARAGDENDPAVGQAVMNALKAVAQQLNCFVLGIDHFGKNLVAGTRGASSKEAAGDLVLACLGEKKLSGNVVNTRLAVRKNRGGRQGQEHPFVLRIVEAPEPDEDGEPVTTMVVDWQPAGAAGTAQPAPDPWAGCRRQDQRTAVLRLKRVLMSILADQGVDLPIPPDGPLVRMVDQEIVRQQFYSQTSAEGTPKRKRQFRNQQFRRALGWAEDQQLIGIGESGDITYVWLARLDANDDEARSD